MAFFITQLCIIMLHNCVLLFCNIQTAYTELENNLEALKLNAIKEYLPNYLEGDKQLSLAEILKQLTDKELNYRKHRSARMSIHTAHFPYQKEIKDFDFNFQPSVDKGKITNLMSMEFVENARNVLFIGSSGVGKTHLAPKFQE